MELWIVILVSIGLYYVYKNNTPKGKAENSLDSVYKKMQISTDDIIAIDIPRDVFRKGIDEYYSVLKKVFDSETIEERKLTSDVTNIISNKHSPSRLLSNSFFESTGLRSALTILCQDLDYVVDGSGWVNYKKCLLDALSGGAVMKNKDDDIRIKFNSDIYIDADKNTYDYESEYPDYYWHVNVFYKDKEVLSCSGIPNDNTNKDVMVFTFKPDEWILDIRKAADKYYANMEKMKLRESTKKEKEALFR